MDESRALQVINTVNPISHVLNFKLYFLFISYNNILKYVGTCHKYDFTKRPSSWNGVWFTLQVVYVCWVVGKLE